MTVIKVVKNHLFQKIQLPMKPTGHYCFLLFHSHNQKTKSEPPNSQQKSEDKISTKSDMCEV